MTDDEQRRALEGECEQAMAAKHAMHTEGRNLCGILMVLPFADNIYRSATGQEPLPIRFWSDILPAWFAAGGVVWLWLMRGRSVERTLQEHMLAAHRAGIDLFPGMSAAERDYHLRAGRDDELNNG
jgi:hypothetical protein